MPSLRLTHSNCADVLETWADWFTRTEGVEICGRQAFAFLPISEIDFDIHLHRVAFTRLSDSPNHVILADEEALTVRRDLEIELLDYLFHTSASHLAREDPDEPEAGGEEAHDDVDSEVEESVALAGLVRHDVSPVVCVVR